jgi:hypothetical protein
MKIKYSKFWKKKHAGSEGSNDFQATPTRRRVS